MRAHTNPGSSPKPAGDALLSARSLGYSGAGGLTGVAQPPCPTFLGAQPVTALGGLGGSALAKGLSFQGRQWQG